MLLIVSMKTVSWIISNENHMVFGILLNQFLGSTRQSWVIDHFLTSQL